MSVKCGGHQIARSNIQRLAKPGFEEQQDILVIPSGELT